LNNLHNKTGLFLKSPVFIFFNKKAVPMGSGFVFGRGSGIGPVGSCGTLIPVAGMCGPVPESQGKPRLRIWAKPGGEISPYPLPGSGPNTTFELFIMIS
jgi:hypothetical protein